MQASAIQGSRRKGGVKIVIRTNDRDFEALAVRAMQKGEKMHFIYDASTFENMSQPIDLYVDEVVAVM